MNGVRSKLFSLPLHLNSKSLLFPLYQVDLPYLFQLGAPLFRIDTWSEDSEHDNKVYGTQGLHPHLETGKLLQSSPACTPLAIQNQSLSSKSIRDNSCRNRHEGSLNVSTRFGANFHERNTELSRCILPGLYSDLLKRVLRWHGLSAETSQLCALGKCYTLLHAILTCRSDIERSLLFPTNSMAAPACFLSMSLLRFSGLAKNLRSSCGSQRVQEVVSEVTCLSQGLSGWESTQV